MEWTNGGSAAEPMPTKSMSLATVQTAKKLPPRAASAGAAPRTPFSLQTTDIEGASPQPKRHTHNWHRTESLSLTAVDGPRQRHRPRSAAAMAEANAPIDGVRRPLVNVRGERHTNPLAPAYTLPKSSALTSGSRPASAAQPKVVDGVAERISDATSEKKMGAVTYTSQQPPPGAAKGDRALRGAGEFKTQNAGVVQPLLRDPDATTRSSRPASGTTRITPGGSDAATVQGVLTGEGHRDVAAWKKSYAEDRQKLLKELKRQQDEAEAVKRGAHVNRERADLQLVTADITGTKSFAEAISAPNIAGKRNPVEPRYHRLDDGESYGAFEQGVRTGMRRWLSHRDNNQSLDVTDIEGTVPRVPRPNSRAAHQQHVKAGEQDVAANAARFSINNLLLSGESIPQELLAAAHSKGSIRIKANNAARASGKRRIVGSASGSHGSPIRHFNTDGEIEQYRTASIKSFAIDEAATMTSYNAAKDAANPLTVQESEVQRHMKHPRDQTPNCGETGHHPRCTFSRESKGGRGTNPGMPDYQLSAFARLTPGAVTGLPGTELAPAKSTSLHRELVEGGTVPPVFKVKEEKPLQVTRTFAKSQKALAVSRRAQNLREDIEAVRNLPQ